MCRYWATEFPCKCASWHNSGYDFCAKHNNGCKRVSLKKYVWKTFCPAGRKALGGGLRRSLSNTNTNANTNAGADPVLKKRLLPACYAHLIAEEGGVENLCRRCDSSTGSDQVVETGSALWHCPDHVELVAEDPNADLTEAQTFFEKAVALWPTDHRARYLRRKSDKKCRGVWWSF